VSLASLVGSKSPVKAVCEAGIIEHLRCLAGEVSADVGARTGDLVD
jgi:hypothetical protein